MNERKIVSIFLIIGMILSLFLVYEHFSASASKFCSFGSTLDCGILNKSPYANLDGIFYLLTIDLNINFPLINISDINWFFDFLTTNAFLSFLTLLFVYILNKNQNKKIFWIKEKDNKKWIVGILIFATIYGAGYLFAIQKFILITYCLVCILLDLVIIFSLFLMIKVKD